jgi:hypothetical protein
LTQCHLNLIDVYLQRRTLVEHHAAAIASIAAGAAVFAGCEALTWGVGTVGAAVGGNLVSYGMSCGSSAGGCSVTGAVLSADAGALDDLFQDMGVELAQFDGLARGGDVEIGGVSLPGGVACSRWIGARP